MRILLLKSVPALLVAVLAWDSHAQQNSQSRAATRMPATFTVSSVRIEGNTLLPERSLTSAIATLPGVDRSIIHLERAAEAIQNLYRQAGYGGVVAYVPEQDLVKGVALIRVVEGKIGKVTVAGAPRSGETNVRRSLPSLKEGKTPKLSALDADVQLANESPVKGTQVKLKAGSMPGEIDADIEVTEQRALRLLVGAENTGSESTGDYRFSVGLQHGNLWNRDHVGTAQYQTSPTEPDQVRIFSLGYRAPLYGWKSSLDAYYVHSNVDNGTTVTPAGPLTFTGVGDVAGLRWNRYLTRQGEYDHRLGLGLDWRDYDNRCAVGNFGAAGCGSAAASVTVMPLTLSYSGQSQGPSGAIGGSLSYSYNLGGSSEEELVQARNGAKRHYGALRASVFATVGLPHGMTLQTRLSGQFSSNALISGEQFGIGGATSVRGYQEREVAGDSGLAATIEWSSPSWVPSVGGNSIALRILLFGDYGQVSNKKDGVCRGTEEHCSLSSVGTGIRTEWGRWASLRFDVGYRLEDGAQRQSGSYRGHVALNIVY